MLRSALLLLAALMTACHDVHLEPREGTDGIAIADDLFAVSVPSADHVVAAGYWGAIYVSRDGGGSWERGVSDVEGPIYDVSMADTERGFACGQRGLLLRTDDGGSTWRRLVTPKEEQGVHFFSLHALDANRVWVVGEWGTRIYSDDGGETWADYSLTIGVAHQQFVWLSIDDQERVRAGERVFEDLGITDVWCLPDEPEYCWMVGEFGTILRTDSGGIDGENPAWENGTIVAEDEPAPVLLEPGATELSDDQIEYLEAYAESLLDRPHLSVAVQPRMSEAEAASYRPGDDPYPLFEMMDARGQAVRFALEGAGLLSDRLRQRGTPPWDYEDYLEDNPEMVKSWISGRVADSPRVDLEIAQSPYLFSVRFADAQRGLVSALGGVVLRTEDGGVTWRYSDVGRKGAVFAVHPLEDARILAAGEKGLVRVSSDGGNSWSRPTSGFPKVFTFFRDIAFSDDRHVGYMVGQGGIVLRTSDGGSSWKQVFPRH